MLTAGASAVFEKAMEQFHREERYRHFVTLSRQTGDHPRAVWHTALKPPAQGRQPEPLKQKQQDVIVWCSNDYLNMSQHPKVLAAAQEALMRHGLGAGGTRNIAGTNTSIVELELTLRQLHKTEAALIFTSGYVANLASIASVLTMLGECTVFSDQANHASMISGIASARARNPAIERVIFAHNDMSALQRALAGVDRNRHKMIAVESIYSMDGDIAPLDRIIALARRYEALVYLDEVHAVGMYGPTGAGIAEQYGLADAVDIIQGTLGKAFGAVGGYICADQIICDAIRSSAAPFIFTTALSPVIAAGAKAAITHLRTSKSEREAQQAAVRYSVAACTRLNIPVMPPLTAHILPIRIGDAVRVKAISRDLLEQGHYLQPINYPTVAKGTERLRITPGPKHTRAMIDEMTEALAESIDRNSSGRPEATPSG